jgi:uncharacterized protein YbcV (DUF1398 family)
MDTQIITEAAIASLGGTKTFPEIVSKLISAGVEYYHVDYVGRCTQYYDGAGGRVITAIDFPDLPPIASDFDAGELRAAILDSQRNGQKFRAFSARAMAAGVQGYYAFLRGRRVTYFGRAGDQHTEWFPGAGPKAN